MSSRTVITLRPDPKTDPGEFMNSLLPSPITQRARYVGSHWEIILEDPEAVLSQVTADALAVGLMSQFGVGFSYEVREFEV